jgi:phosphoribosylglycinamide formyltransferase 1
LLLPDGDYMTDPLKLGILISGGGSNLQSIIDQIENGALAAVIKVVISNRTNSYGIIRAKNHGIPSVILNHKEFPRREDFDHELIQILKSAQVDLVILAGFMRILSPVLLRAFPQMIINIHPALLPAFPGLHVQQKALDYGVKFSGCTVHFVDDSVDSGPIIIQSVVPVLPGDNEESLAARILKEEHRIYPQAIQFFAQGRILLTGRKVQIKDAEKESLATLHNPPLEGF